MKCVARHKGRKNRTFIVVVLLKLPWYVVVGDKNRLPLLCFSPSHLKRGCASFATKGIEKVNLSLDLTRKSVSPYRGDCYEFRLLNLGFEKNRLLPCFIAVYS